jgi:RluA family pseudouridine synthase
MKSSSKENLSEDIFWTWKTSFPGPCLSNLDLQCFVNEKLKSINSSKESSIKIGEISKRKIKLAIENGACLVNERYVTRANVDIKKNDTIKFAKDFINFQIFENPKFLKISILYEDNDLLVINKPCNVECTNSDLLDRFFKNKNYFLVHRLDKLTSGCLIIAKNSKTLKLLEKQFKEKKIDKTYLCVVDGNIDFARKEIDSFLQKDFSKKTFGQTIYKLSKSNGLRSVTKFLTIKNRKKYSLLFCYPVTGRTHQIRATLNSLNYPILGDFLYSQEYGYENSMPRLFLHSIKVSFTHPVTNEKIAAISPIDEKFSKFIKMPHLINLLTKDK